MAATGTEGPSVAPTVAVTNKRKDNGDDGTHLHEKKRATSSITNNNAASGGGTAATAAIVAAASSSDIPTNLPLHQWTAGHVAAYIRSDAIGVRRAVAGKWSNESMDGATLAVMRSADDLKPTGLNMGERIRVWAWIISVRTSRLPTTAAVLPPRSVVMSRKELDDAVTMVADDDKQSETLLAQRLLAATARPSSSDTEYGDAMIVDANIITRLKWQTSTSRDMTLSVPASIVHVKDMLPLLLTILDMKATRIRYTTSDDHGALACINGQTWFDRSDDIHFVKLARRPIVTSNGSTTPIVDHYASVGILQLEPCYGDHNTPLTSSTKGRVARINQYIRSMQLPAGNTAIAAGKAKPSASTPVDQSVIITSVVTNLHRICFIQAMMVLPLEGNGGPVWESRCSPDYLLHEPSSWSLLLAWINASPSSLGWHLGTTISTTITLPSSPSPRAIRLHTWLGHGRTAVVWRATLDNTKQKHGDNDDDDVVVKVFTDASHATAEIAVLEHAARQVAIMQATETKTMAPSVLSTTGGWPIGMPRLIGTSTCAPKGMMIVTQPIGRPLTEIRDHHIRQGVSLCWWLHQHGIEHCDLEPRHFMTTGTDNDLLIIDWGFARLSSVGSHRHPGTILFAANRRLNALAHPDATAPSPFHWDLASFVKCMYAITFPRAGDEAMALPPRQPAVVLAWWQTELGDAAAASSSSSSSIWAKAVAAAEHATEWTQYEHVMDLLLSVIRSRPSIKPVAVSAP